LLSGERLSWFIKLWVDLVEATERQLVVGGAILLKGPSSVLSSTGDPGRAGFAANWPPACRGRASSAASASFRPLLRPRCCCRPSLEELELLSTKSNEINQIANFNNEMRKNDRFLSSTLKCWFNLNEHEFKLLNRGLELEKGNFHFWILIVFILRIKRSRFCCRWWMERENIFVKVNIDDKFMDFNLMIDTW